MRLFAIVGLRGERSEGGLVSRGGGGVWCHDRERVCLSPVKLW